MQEISHIIWDWNGTLLNDTQACVNTLNTLLQVRNLPTLSVDRYRELFDFPVYDFYRTVGFELDNEDWDELSVTFHELFRADESLALHADTMSTLENMRERGYRQSVLSASHQSILDSMICEYKLRDFFQWVRGIDNLYGDSKINAGGQLVHDMGISGREILLVGDSLHDYEVARKLGVRCLLVACGHQAHARLALTGNCVLDSIGDVAEILNAS
jgi:phosphoglycolate phosphatase